MCAEYRRFQKQVLRMIASLARSGVADCSTAAYPVVEYPVSAERVELVELVLDAYPMSEKTRRDLRAPTRHLFWYAEQAGGTPERIDDALMMRFITQEIPRPNKGSAARVLRCVRQAAEYLKRHRNTSLRHN